MKCAALAVLLACAPPASASRPAPPGPDPLGMNDLSVLLPLPDDLARPVLAAVGGDGPPLIDRRWFDALVARPADIAPRSGAAAGFGDYQVVAVRFDLCDRRAIGPCPRDAAGRLRLVLQPLYTRGDRTLAQTFAQDIALHAFYPIPPGDLPAVLDELRGLARLQPAPRDAPLAVSSAARDPAYRAGLRALVLRYARAEALVRLTVIGQIADAAAFAWRFRGLDRRGDGFAPMVIPELAATEQTAQLAGGDTVYRIAPVADAPAGFALAVNGPRFNAAGNPGQAAALAALAAIQNPRVRGNADTQCVACHVATHLMARRTARTGIAAASLPNWFDSPAARAAPNIAGDDARVVRAFGWAGNVPAISQRVANETAEVLAEIAARQGAPASP